MTATYESFSAFRVQSHDEVEADVRVTFIDGKPAFVFFRDDDGEAVTVPYKYWDAIVSAVERTVEHEAQS